MEGILLDDNNDLQIPFKRGDTSGQNQFLLLMLEKGEIKENPEATVGIESYINDDEIDEMMFEIRVRFENDRVSQTEILNVIEQIKQYANTTN